MQARQGEEVERMWIMRRRKELGKSEECADIDTGGEVKEQGCSTGIRAEKR